MAAMLAVQTKPKLLYSLSTRPPIPFAVHPTYPIRLPTRDLPTAYLESLWSSTQPDLIRLESFARLLFALKSQKSRTEFETLLRTCIKPLHDFDRRWRDSIPDLLTTQEEEEDQDERDGGIDAAKNERDMVYEAYEKWEVNESERLEQEKAKREAKGKEKALDQNKMDDDADEDDNLEPEGVSSEQWLSDKEVHETRMQALLLLSLLALPPLPVADQSATQVKKGRGRKKKDSERDPATLDPALLLDFLTDRLQIWRVMQGLSTEDDLETAERSKTDVVETKDCVQEWWSDIVEPLFRNDVGSDVLAHHRVKLFPDSATLDSNVNRQAALYEERSLMSLDRSARRRDLRESQAIIAESPTMKRLMSFGHQPGDKVNNEETFKMPPLPSHSASTTSTTIDRSRNDRDAARKQKQDRARKLPRGDSATANMREMLKRREVSLSKTTRVSGAAKSKSGDGKGESEEFRRKRKRKSASPQKLSASSRAVAENLMLVPDTPAKPVLKAPSFKKPFSRAISLPSFAALGTAFRPGAAAPDSNPSSIEDPGPSLQQTRFGGEGDMDYPMNESYSDGSDGDFWLASRTEDISAKGGRSRNTSGSTDGDDPQSQGTGVETPRKPRTVLVADTPS
ncbi:uncharacterized protein JCM15063_003543 [Sporobolomyces koalae]|uniref:uncharacterized protein n=1 Tax=Sporobolomyces koalae TaxID=500713 RepID=UPI00317AD539